MRAKPSNEQKTKKQSWAGTLEYGAEAAIFATLGLATMLAIVLAVVSGSLPAKSGPPLSSAGERSSIVKYLGSRQLAADARTLASMAHYLMEPEGPTGRNASASEPSKGISFPTNTPGAAPKA